MLSVTECCRGLIGDGPHSSDLLRLTPKTGHCKNQNWSLTFRNRPWIVARLTPRTRCQEGPVFRFSDDMRRWFERQLATDRCDALTVKPAPPSSELQISSGTLTSFRSSGPNRNVLAGQPKTAALIRASRFDRHWYRKPTESFGNPMIC
jgi:hypothetical protein